MKCKSCKHCKQGWFKEMPTEYVCIGVKRPFIIDDIDHECTEYQELREQIETNPYDELVQNLNAAKWEIKERNDTSLSRCLKYIKNAIIEAGRLNAKYANLSAEYDMFKLMCRRPLDDWMDD